MQIYKVDYGEFFAFSNAQEIKEYFDRNHALCHEPMTQLIKRYGLQNKRILSVGSSVGFEEYCFYENGCALTFCDIDESQKIEPYLKQLKPATEGRFLTFVIGDAQELTVDEKFDVCYFSSFTPNELRNASLVRKHLRSILGVSWSAKEKPFVDTVTNIAHRMLAQNGLFIYQSYASGVDARHKNYVNGIKSQLGEIGLQLRDIYYFDGHPNVHLVVAGRGNVKQSDDEGQQITMFHGRGIPNIKFKGIRKVLL